MVKQQLPFEPQMVPIPAGVFLMGTGEVRVDRLARESDLARRWQEKGFFGREQPQHAVRLAVYELGRYPVTVGQYRVFVVGGGYERRAYWTEAGWAWRAAMGRTRPDFWAGEPWAGNDQLPVVGVSWYEAAAYCRWLAEATGRAYRLPSEAEWEKAARGTDGRLYPWGDEFDAARCNTRAGGLGRTVPVGRYSPVGDSPHGCAEMVGNVSEWTLTRFVPYPYIPNDGRDDLEGEALRVTRGGSWHSPTLRARAASRGMNDPFFTDNDLGFRCACGK